MTGVSLQTDVKIGLGTFSMAWFVVYLRKKEEGKNGLLCSIHHRLAAIQIAVFCAMLIFMDANEGCGDFPPAPLKHTLTRPTFYLVWLEVMCFDNTLWSLSISLFHIAWSTICAGIVHCLLKWTLVNYKVHVHLHRSAGSDQTQVSIPSPFPHSRIADG